VFKYDVKQMAMTHENSKKHHHSGRKSFAISENRVISGKSQMHTDKHRLRFSPHPNPLPYALGRGKCILMI
jgi:hypothetical protein